MDTPLTPIQQHRQFEKEKARAEEAERRVDELEPALARSETERDEWKAKHAALRAAVQVMLAHAEPDSWEDLRLRRVLDRDAARTPQADPDTVTLRRDDLTEPSILRLAAADLRRNHHLGINGLPRSLPATLDALADAMEADQ